MKKWLKRLRNLILLLVISAIAGAASILYGSLPRLDGEASLEGLVKPVKVARDEAGVPTIEASSVNDLWRAQGFVHAQERFFQMDLLRRSSAGELSELFGRLALAHDRSRRFHRLRAAAKRAIGMASKTELAALRAYTAGVNAGLVDLKTRPFEYWLLRQTPRKWLVEDSFMVIYSMYLDLNDANGYQDSRSASLRQLVSAEVADFLMPKGSPWDAALDGTLIEQPAIPGMVVKKHTEPSRQPTPGHEEKLRPGSNNWAVNGTRTKDGRAILANDMHLGFHVPHIWFRARLKFDGLYGAVDATGVSLPGAPGLVAGSNGKVAWGFTNSYVDTTDLVVLQTDAANPDEYQTAQGSRAFESYREEILVKGQSSVILDVKETIWGPVRENPVTGEHYAVSWIGHYPEAANFRQIEFLYARSLVDIQAMAHGVGSPPQNMVAVDDQGNAGWTIMGSLPKRQGFDAYLPADWSQADTGWSGWLDAAQYPVINNPANGQVWSANSRVVGGEMLATIGDGGYALGARARQIRDRLAALAEVDEEKLLAIQLDDEALFLNDWQQLAIDIWPPSDQAPFSAQAEALIRDWGGRAAVESVGYRIVRGFRNVVRNGVIHHLIAPAIATDADFKSPRFSQFEGSLWALIKQRPAHLIPSGYSSWGGFLRAKLGDVLEELGQNEGGLVAQTWGRRNTLNMQHPMSKSLPFLSGLLDMPAQALPGDHNMPRVQGASFGASERFVVSPGHEEQGIFEMPGGQSGHPLSSYYKKGHSDWSEGQPAPFLPGETTYTLRLVP